jgi:putative ABC transport system permease protein
MRDPLTEARLRWPLVRLALQNLGRRPARAGVQILAVALGVGVALAALVAREAVTASTEVGFGRMGADLLVVPRDALVNVSPALLTVEPGPFTLSVTTLETIARLPGVQIAAPQRYHIVVTGDAHTHDAELVAFDPERDFTVLPWVRDRPDRPLRAGEVIVGARRPEQPGSEVTLAGKTLTVYGRLELTGVGPFDRSFFATFETAGNLVADGDRDHVSAVLVKLDGKASPEQVRFALSASKDVKIVSGTPLVTSVRQLLSTILAGALVFTALVLVATLLQIGVLYTAVLAERRHELGLLLVLGAHAGQVTRTVLLEAGLTTGLGGLAGVLVGALLLLFFQHVLVSFLQPLDFPVAWPRASVIGAVSLACLAVGAAVGPLGAALPTWRLCRSDPYELARGGTR